MKKTPIIVTVIFVLIGGLIIYFLNQNANDPSAQVEVVKPDSAGNPGDVMVVMDQYLWVDEPGNAVKDSMHQYMEGLNRPEYLYNLMRYERIKFKNQRKQLRNIIEFEIDKTKKTNMIVKNNVWAKNQVFIKIHSTNKTNLAAYFRNNFNKIRKLINENDRKANLSFLKRNHKLEEEQKIEKSHQVKMVVPDGFVIKKNLNDFVWLERRRLKFEKSQYHDQNQGVYIYHYPYTDTNTFTTEFQIAKRDSMLKQNVPGKYEGSYVMTELLEGYEPSFRAITIKEKYALESRGLWKLSEGFMGGSFVSVTRYDENNRRIVTAEGYVYAPYFNKMRLVREMEALISSIDFI